MGSSIRRFVKELPKDVCSRWTLADAVTLVALPIQNTVFYNPTFSVAD